MFPFEEIFFHEFVKGKQKSLFTRVLNKENTSILYKQAFIWEITLLTICIWRHMIEDPSPAPLPLYLLASVHNVKNISAMEEDTVNNSALVKLKQCHEFV